MHDGPFIAVIRRVVRFAMRSVAGTERRLFGNFTLFLLWTFGYPLMIACRVVEVGTVWKAVFFRRKSGVDGKRFSRFAEAMQFERFLTIFFIGSNRVHMRNFITLTLLLRGRGTGTIRYAGLRDLYEATRRQLGTTFRLIYNLIHGNRTRSVLHLHVTALSRVDRPVDGYVHFSHPDKHWRRSVLFRFVGGTLLFAVSGRGGLLLFGTMVCDDWSREGETWGYYWYPGARPGVR